MRLFAPAKATLFAECGGLAKLSGVMVSVIDADRGLFKADDVSRLYRRPHRFRRARVWS